MIVVSTPMKGGWAVAEKSSNSLGRVVAGPGLAHLRGLGAELVGQLSGPGVTEQALHPAEGGSRARREPLGQLASPVVDLGGRHHLGAPAPVERLGPGPP